MRFSEHYYFGLLKRYAALFGTLFNDITIQRTDANNAVTDTLRVPLLYGPKDKMLARVNQDPGIDRTSALTLPVMSFEQTGYRYASERKISTANRVFTLANTTSTSSLRFQYAPVPYDIDYELTIAVKNTEDGDQIVEQILPFFTPDWTIAANMVPEMGSQATKDIPLILHTITHADSYDGSFSARRALTWTLGFTMKADFYGPVKRTGVILYANTHFYADTSANNVAAYALTRPGLTANGQPTSNAALSINATSISANSNYGYIEQLVEL